MVDTVVRESAELNFEIDMGSTFRHVITWSTGEEGAEELVDLTDCTARMHMRSTVTSAVLVHEATTENDGITLGGALGTIEIFISDTDTSAFTFKNNKGVYGLEIIFPDTLDVRRLLRGKVKVFDETTRP